MYDIRRGGDDATVVMPGLDAAFHRVGVSIQQRSISMRLFHRSSRVVLLASVHLVVWCGVAHAQGRPSGSAPRLWLELGVSAAAAHRCMTCRPSTVGGGSATAAAGITLPNGFGVGLLSRAFSELGFEAS